MASTPSGLRLPLCYFDAEECATGIKALKSYRKEWDEERACWRDKPRHDWACNGADAFRYLAMGWREIADETVETPEQQTAKAIAELVRPQTLNEMLEEYDAEREEAEV